MNNDYDTESLKVFAVEIFFSPVNEVSTKLFFTW